MISPKKPTPTNAKINEWMRRVWDNMQSLRPSGGPGVKVRNGTSGFTLALEDLKNPFMVYKGDFNDTDSYEVNDLVRVKANKAYTESESGQPVGVESCAGFYICVAAIPPVIDTGEFNNAPSYVQSYVQGITRVNGRVYAPIYPEPTTNCYWHLIAFAPVQTFICVEGVNTPYYVNASISGSTQVT